MPNSVQSMHGQLNEWTGVHSGQFWEHRFWALKFNQRVFEINNKNVTYLILKLWGATLVGWQLKKRVPNFKITEITHRKFEKFVILFFQVTVNNYHHDILPYISQNYGVFFFIFSLFVYLFHMHINSVMVRLWLDF